jgi:hypothetical protein
MGCWQVDRLRARDRQAVWCRQGPEKAPEPELWKKKHSAARTRREYRTAEDLLRDAGAAPGDAAPKQAILDMRGPQVGG